MESVEFETTMKKTIILCDICTNLKAKDKCEECGKMLCIKCKTKFRKGLHTDNRDSVCQKCYDNLIYQDRHTCCSIL